MWKRRTERESSAEQATGTPEQVANTFVGKAWKVSQVGTVHGGLHVHQPRGVTTIILVIAVMITAVTVWVYAPKAGVPPTTSTAPVEAPGSSSGRAGSPAFPSRVDPVEVGERTRSVDVCKLLRTPALRQFGDVRVFRGTALFGCGVEITGPDGSRSSVDYEMRGPTEWDRDRSDDGERRDLDLGGIQVYQSALQGEGTDSSCTGLIVLSDHNAFYGRSALIRQGGQAPDMCELLQAANSGAVGLIAHAKTVPYTNYTRPYFLASKSACALVDGRTLGKIKNLDRYVYPEFADWGCKWGKNPDKDTVLPSVILQFQLRTPDEFRKARDQQPVELAGTTAYQTTAASEQESNTCTIYLPEQRQPDETGYYQVVQIKVRATDSRATRCGYAQAVATAAQKSLS